MARRIYSTSTTLDPAALRAASRVVDKLLLGRVYDTDADGMPTDPDVVDAMAEATESIAGALEASGVLQSATADVWDSVKIGSVSLSGRSQSPAAVTVAGVPVPPAALLALGDVGTFEYRVLP